MKKFLFKFASLLKTRRHHAQLEQQKMSVLLQNRRHLLEQLAEEEENLKKIFGDSSKNDYRIGNIRMGYQYMHDRKRSILFLQDEIGKLNSEIEDQKDRVIESNKRIKIIELIEAKDRLKHMKEQEMEEQFQLNEIATQMFNRTN